tara:strand:- start:2060 stop:2545 length:486 start_codon:yes stop_codon:yes gene_type:complete
MLTKKQEKLYSLSLEEANKSNMLFKHGCVATYGGHVIASGYNTHKSYSSHDEFLQKQCSFHAEMDVLRKIYWRNNQNRRKQRRIMRRTTLYISRSSNTGNSTNSAPCAQCLTLIKQYEIRKIIFHMDDCYYEYDPKDYETNHRTFGELSVIKKNPDCFIHK